MIEETLYTRLTDNAGVGALVSTRVYPVLLPQDAAFPALSYFKVSDRPINDFSGENATRNTRFQIDCWAAGYSDVKSLENAVKAAMVSGADFNVVREMATDLYDDEMKLFRVTMDFSIWY